MGSEKSFGFVSLSTLIHSGLAIALLVAPELTPLPMGSEASTVEFETQAPKGKQLVAVVEKPDEEATAAPASKPESQPTPPPTPRSAKVVAPAPVPAAVEKREAVQKVEIATKLPEKEVSEPAAEEAVVTDESDMVVAVANEEEEPPSEEVIEEPTKEDPAILAESETPTETDKPSEEMTEIEESESEKKVLVEETKEAQEEVLAQEIVDAEEEALPQETLESQETTRQAIQKQPETQVAASPAAYGDPNSTRDYMDLKQVPGNQPPRYPEKARLQRQQGKVILKYFVTPNGQVENLQLLQSSGYAQLDQEAVNAVSRFKYRPGQQGWTQHPVNFLLKGPEERMGGRLRTSMNP